jgi:hypothetical protein
VAHEYDEQVTVKSTTSAKILTSYAHHLKALLCGASVGHPGTQETGIQQEFSGEGGNQAASLEAPLKSNFISIALTRADIRCEPSNATYLPAFNLLADCSMQGSRHQLRR